MLKAIGMNHTRKTSFLYQVKQLLTTQRVGVLSTRFKNSPHQSLVAFVSSDDLRYIFFVTPTYSRKVTAMDEDPEVALLIDNRQNLESDLDACVAVTLKGTAEKISERHEGCLLARYLEKHPYLEEFAASLSCSQYAIRVRSYSLVSRFQKVEELFLQ